MSNFVLDPQQSYAVQASVAGSLQFQSTPYFATDDPGQCGTTFTPVAQTLYLASFGALTDFVVSTIGINTRNIAAATVTTSMMGLFLINPDGSITLLDKTANNLTFFTNTFQYRTSLLSVGNIRGSVNSRYACGVLVDATTLPTFYGAPSFAAPPLISSKNPYLWRSASVTAQTDIAANYSFATLNSGLGVAAPLMAVN